VAIEDEGERSRGKALDLAFVPTRPDCDAAVEERLRAQRVQRRARWRDVLGALSRKSEDEARLDHISGYIRRPRGALISSLAAPG